MLRVDKKPENPAEDTVTSLTETKENKPANNKVTRLSSAGSSHFLVNQLVLLLQGVNPPLHAVN